MNRRLDCLAAALAFGCASSTVPTTIESQPTGARVFVDGASVGETPLDVDLDRRTHRVRLEKDGYAPLTDHISVRIDGDGDFMLRFFGYALSERMYDRKYTFDPSYLFVLEKAGQP